MSILVVGTVAFDTVTTPDGEAREVIGGSAAYFACAAAHFAPVRLLSAVGEDFPDAERQAMGRRGIDLAGLETVPGGSTFRWHGRYGRNLKEVTTLSVALNVMDGYTPRLPAAWQDSAFVFLANCDPAAQLATLCQLKAPKLVICDTMNHWLENSRDQLEKLLARVDVLLINDEEARALTGEDHLIRAGQAMLAAGPRIALIKKGEHGALLLTGPDDYFFVPAYPTLRVVDPTGAGDSFGGGFTGWLAGAGSFTADQLRLATAYGAVTASFTVEDFSLRALDRASRELIDQRLARLRAMTAF